MFAELQRPKAKKFLREIYFSFDFAIEMAAPRTG